MNPITADFATLEKFLQGTGGFILGVVFSVFIFVKYILPRWDRQIAASEKIADLLKDISIQQQDIIDQQKEERHGSFEQIIKLLNEKGANH